MKYILILAPSLLLTALVVRGFRREGPPPEPPSPYTIAGGRVTLSPGSKLPGKLEIVTVGAASDQSVEFRTVGQVIALSNTSGELTGDRIGWVELEPKLTQSVELKLDGGEPAGVAYGLTNLPAEYATRIAAGQTLQIARYGLKRGGVSGVIRKVVRVEGDGINVVFRFQQAQDWFPGTNCEVSFPLLRGRPVRIPTTSAVHEGIQDYVWRETAPGQFEAQLVSMVDATPDDLAVLGLNPGDRIVARGAILLKPLLAPLLAQRKD